MDAFDKAPENGLCSGKNTDMWFPPSKKGTPSNAEKMQRIQYERMAKEICSVCPKLVHCREYSLRHEPFGTWGGLNEVERAEIRVRRGINLSRDGRIIVPGIGSMNAVTGEIVFKKKAAKA